MKRYSVDQFIAGFGDYIDAIDTIYKLKTFNKGEVLKVYNLIKQNLIEPQVYSPIKIISIICDVMLLRYRFFKSYMLIIKKIIDDYKLQNLEYCNPVVYFYLYKEFNMIFEYGCESYDNPFPGKYDFIEDLDQSNSIYNAIINDDIKLFVSIAEGPGTNLYQAKKISYNPEEFGESSKETLMEFTLLEFCCYHGAVKCFKFLRTRCISEITQKCLQFSFLSGVPDILNECLKYQRPDQKCMKYAIISHNIDFVTFLMNEFHLKINVNLCAKYKNISAFFAYINRKLDRYDVDSSFYCSLTFAISSMVRFFFKTNNIKCRFDMKKAVSIIIENNHYELIKLFASLGADFNVKDEMGKTYLHQAAESNVPEMINELCSHGVNVNARDNFRKTPIHYATINNHKESVQALISCGAKVNAKDYYYGKTPLHYAIENNNIQIIQLLISHGASVNSNDIDFNTTLHIAAERNNTKIAELLISLGVNVNAKNKDGQIPLHYASMNNCQDVGKFLISNGSYINIKDKNGKTPLHYATFYKKKEFAEMLITSKADVYSEDIDKKTPLHYAVENNIKETVQLLILHGANVNATDKNGKTPLHFATKNNSIEIVKILCAKRADVNSQDINLITPLHIAANNNCIDVINVLISYGANVNSLNIDEQTPLHLASKKGYEESIKILLSNEANPNLIDLDGISPIGYAIQSKNMNMKMLITLFGFFGYLMEIYILFIK
ncbi:ankyrin repeat protein, putative [Trichomonas vaginalis G3]|uniref:Ankyrin repeat protein, putative n=1 Tax=Trichomonas vaginalis (strain ATCC PRA-98 / G3) TaxID=412133 RepID=A2EK94_TRIV3|nr:POTE ankyrin domain family [Trichomonas vaginalis G3]EAY06892.1 ankyrin repeat protein, putative [Trichomonas vaginalis G3]KAI5513947.1 POTE ankyrin domain family [Trichomonas vaginalis G3]|eukprot:XP_001319115.1 ankyrin repeat protein [Trichomonas vaginalis G3]